MVGFDIAVGYLFHWALQKVRRAGGAVDQQVDRVIDAEIEHLGDVVDRKLGLDPAVQKLQVEAADGLEEPSERTRRRVADSLAEAADTDPEFAARLQAALDAISAEVAASRTASSGVGGTAIVGDVQVQADRGSVSAVTVTGDVAIHPQIPGSSQG